MPLRRMFATPCDRCFWGLRPAGPFYFFRFSPLTCLFPASYLPLTCLLPASFLPLHSDSMCREPLRIWLFGVASYRFGKPLHRFQDSYLSSLLMAASAASSPMRRWTMCVHTKGEKGLTLSHQSSFPGFHKFHYCVIAFSSGCEHNGHNLPQGRGCGNST